MVKTHEIYKSHINYSRAYPKLQDKSRWLQESMAPDSYVTCTVYAEIFVVLKFPWVPSTMKIKPTKILLPGMITARHYVSVMSVP